MLERSAHKFYNIIQEVVKKMVRHKEGKGHEMQSSWIMKKTKELKEKENDKSVANSINMKVLLGYLN